ncbi:hypothetical protein SKP52_07980 [Sphingopyxis fribergensis]|uniref:TonB-dependent receptor n=2 Tax=Sphingopyxis fribergensis TaxID=1515612 RepID=A0A0A7PER3_9SPHN|nr:hypothetical protein SKP52_07980 [Sphingopyxis fribergensis]
MLLLAAPVAARAADDAAQIDVPAGPLGKAVATLSRQARIDVGVDDPALHRIATPPIRGTMSAEAALDKLLRGTPATWRSGRNGLFHVVRRPRAVAVPFFAARPKRTENPVAMTPPIEIVVTASKRDAPLADCPATVAILSGTNLGAAGTVPDSEAIAGGLPGVGSTHLGPGRNQLFVRGIIDSTFAGPGEATTAQYLDHARINHNGPDPDLRLYDVASVEVLEGPQGTLYGAGALGGLIRIMTNRPALDRTEARASAGFTHLAHGDPGGDAAATLNLPLVDGKAAVRVVGYAVREGGYIDNPLLGISNINGVSVRGGRAALRVVSAGWTVDLGGVVQSIRADDSQWTDRDGPGLTRSSRAREDYDAHFRQASAAVSRDLGGIQLVSSFAAVSRSMVQRYDNGATAPPFAVTERDRSRMIGGETRLSRQADDGVGWVAGLSLFDSTSLSHRANGAGLSLAELRQRAVNKSREWTLFGEGSFRLAPRLIATAGLRISQVRLQGVAWAKESLSALPGNGRPVVVELDRRDLRGLPSLALSLRPSKHLLLFARYQEGFRPGGVGVTGLQPEIHRGDRLRSWEIGQRLTLPGGKVEIRAAASYATWEGILAQVVSQSGDLMTLNIGDGDIAAIEASADWRPAAGWNVRGGLFLSRSRLTRSDIGTIALKGGRLPNVPNMGLQGSIAREWALSNGLRANLVADIRYFGGSRIGSGPLLDAAQGDYVDDRILLRIADARHGLSLQITNLTDSSANRFALGTPYRIYHPQASPQRPRTIRVGFDAAF